MKKINLLILMLAVAVAGCVDVDCDCNTWNPGDSDFELMNYYEPHVTLTHENHNSKSHFYSVLMIVKKGQKIYEIDRSSGYKYKVEYSFEQLDGSSEIHAIKSYRLDAEYELRMYKYPITEAAFATINQEDGSQFEVFIKHKERHNHRHPDKIHQGTVHRPGDGFPG